VVFFNRLAEIAAQYLKKGSKVYVEGSLRTRKWQNKEGVDQYTTEIVASEMQMLDSRGGAGGDYSPGPDDNYTPSKPQNRRASPLPITAALAILTTISLSDVCGRC